MSLSSPQLRRFVRRALVDAAGTGAADPARLAAAFDMLCERLRRGLEPLFGRTAVAALFARALHVAIAEFSWLADVVPRDGVGCTLDGLAGVGGLDADTVQDGLATVLAHDIGLLAAFIGEDLVLPLVQQAWGAVALPGEPATTEGDQ